ncbi:MAG: response regulator, partial [Methylophaga sp.]|nr:response regulator [Methylophaga sp.]
SLPEYSNKRASVDFQLNNDAIEITIKDQGEGFDWQNYMDFDPSRVMDNHGRGIAIANKMSFSFVEYRGCGNEVMAKLKLNT